MPASLNVSLRAGRFGNHARNKAWDIFIAGEVRNKLPPTPLVRPRLRLVRHAHRMLDFDGLVGSLKPVVDALVSARVLKNDDWNSLGKWEADQVFRPKKDGQMLEILIEEIVKI